jgi:hypothetical protein
VVIKDHLKGLLQKLRQFFAAALKFFKILLCPQYGQVRKLFFFRKVFTDLYQEQG